MSFGSFHVYPTGGQAVDQAPNYYSRATPLQADVVEFCTIPASIGRYDKEQFCYVSVVKQVAEFNGNLLYAVPRDGGIMNGWFMVDRAPNGGCDGLPAPDGSIGGEAAGTDVAVYQKAGYSPNNQSAGPLIRKFLLNPGDRVWFVPGLAGGGVLTNAVAGNGNNTVNYFEGNVLELL